MAKKPKQVPMKPNLPGPPGMMAKKPNKGQMMQNAAMMIMKKKGMK